MYITPEDVKNYTTFETVKNRSDMLVENDILEAVAYVEKIIGKSLDELETNNPKIRLALIKVAQFFALINSDEAFVKGYKSEKLGDYSYTLADGSTIKMSDVSDLLSEFIEPDTSGVFLRVRAL